MVYKIAKSTQIGLIGSSPIEQELIDVLWYVAVVNMIQSFHFSFNVVCSLVKEEVVLISSIFPFSFSRHVYFFTYFLKLFWLWGFKVDAFLHSFLHYVTYTLHISGEANIFAIMSKIPNVVYTILGDAK